jgi:hypothetical protein
MEGLPCTIEWLPARSRGCRGGCLGLREWPRREQLLREVRHLGRRDRRHGRHLGLDRRRNCVDQDQREQQLLVWLGWSDTILHWDGGTWTPVSSRLRADSGYEAVWGSGPNDVWAVGEGGAILERGP